MNLDKKVNLIPAHKQNDKIESVYIYARVSSNTADQLKSLSSQVSSLTQFVAKHYDDNWRLDDTLIDIHSSKTGTQREQLSVLLDYARSGLVDIIVVANISRLGRDTVQVLETISILRACDVRVIFKDDNLDTSKDDHTLIIQFTEAIAQAENEFRSHAIKWGHHKRAEYGLSKLYNRPAFGYVTDKSGNLAIDDEKAEVVRLIFKLYLSGKSFLGIVRELKSLNIKTSTGKEKWSVKTIDNILQNEKYTGRVILLKNNETTPSYQFENHHDPIISESMFEAAQLEREKRTNIENGKRKPIKYSSKKSKK
ncbi:MAG: recombinase family protein [Streptococcaceae bacterium]|nr:recombinase family protein [Streptococcaceae bacterium]